jgi:hypothetical protein
MKTTLLLVLAQTTPAPAPPAATAPGTLTLAAGELDLATLIDRVAGHLGQNILSQPQELNMPGQTRCRLQHPVTLSQGQCIEFLANMLWSQGFALTVMDAASNTWEVLSLSGPRAREVWNRCRQATVEQVLAAPNLKLPVAVVVPLAHANAVIAANSLRPFFANSGMPTGFGLTVGNAGNQRALLLAGMQDQVAQAIRLVKLCDLPPGPEQVEAEQALNLRLQALEARLQALEDRLSPKSGK